MLREVAVADVVHDVVRAVAQCPTQPTRRGRLQPFQLHTTERPHRLERPHHALPLGADVERRQIARAGDDAEDAHGALDRRGRRHS